MAQVNDTTTQDAKEARPDFSDRTGQVFVLLLLLSLAFNWYYLRGGFQGEDMQFVSMLRQDPLPFERWKGFWSVFDIPAITSMWWIEGGVGGAFWRPIPSLVIEASIRVFGERPFPLHLLSIVLHGCVAFTIYLLIRRLTGQSLIALLSALFFVACEDHSMVIGWITTVTDILCVLLINLSLLAHAAWLQRRRPLALIGSLVALVVAMGSKETAATAPLAIVLMSALMPAGRDAEEGVHFMRTARLREDLASFLRDWLSWVPALAILVIYIGVYKGVILGGISTIMYVDPLSQPLQYIGHLVLNMPVMWMATLSVLPPSLVMFTPVFLIPLAAVGLVCFVAWLAALWPLRRRAVVIWAMLVYIIALLPQMASDASERLMYFPYVAASILLAVLLVSIRPVARRLAPHAPRAHLWTRVFGWYALAGILIPGVLMSAAYPFSFVPSFNRLEGDTLTAVPYIRERNPDHIIMLNTAGVMNTFYPPMVIEYHFDRPLDVRILSSCNAVVTLERTGDASFVIRADRPGWLSNMFAKVARVEPTFQEGRVYRNDLFSATLLELTEDRADVLAVRFDMFKPLSDRSVLFLYWSGETFRPLDLTALPAGKRKQLADTSDVWASMM